jgi:hypothetical protein
MNSRLHLLVLLAFCSMAGMSPQEQPKTSSMAVVQRSNLCITEGEISELPGNRLSVSAPKMRAFVTDPALQEVEAHFKYLGRSKKTAALASGQVRRQFGLKLRAQNGCNLVYAMWRIKPKEELVVSVKSNPGMTRSAECDAHGYHNIKPASTHPLPQIRIGGHYTLRAILDHSTMRVFADNKLVWEGDVGADALAFDGPVGVRTDNGHFEFEFFAAKPGAGQQGATAACQGPAEEE